MATRFIHFAEASTQALRDTAINFNQVVAYQRQGSSINLWFVSREDHLEVTFPEEQYAVQAEHHLRLLLGKVEMIS